MTGGDRPRGPSGSSKRPFPRGPRRAFEAQPAAKAIAGVIQAHGLSAEVHANRLVTEWAELVGPKLAQRTRPDGVHERVLWVEVATSAWMHELNLLKPQLLAGLIERLGEPRVFDDVRFRLAGRHRRNVTTVPTARTKAAPRTRTVMPATGAAREQIVREVEAVDDVELRELIARVRINNDR